MRVADGNFHGPRLSAVFLADYSRFAAPRDRGVASPQSASAMKVSIWCNIRVRIEPESTKLIADFPSVILAGLEGFLAGNDVFLEV